MPHTLRAPRAPSIPIHASVRARASQAVMENPGMRCRATGTQRGADQLADSGRLRSSWLSFPPLCNVVPDARLLLRPGIQRARRADCGLVGAGVQHHHIAGAASQKGGEDDQPHVAHADLPAGLVAPRVGPLVRPLIAFPRLARWSASGPPQAPAGSTSRPPRSGTAPRSPTSGRPAPVHA